MSRTVGLGLAALVLVSAGCADKDANRYLDAIKRADYDAAFAELHTEARATIATPEVMKAKFEASGLRLVDYSTTCSSGGFSNKRLGYNTTTSRKGGGQVVIGVPPASVGKCNTSVVVDLKKDEALPGQPMKVIGSRF